MTTNQHFALGAVAKIRKGAKPVGWHESMGRFNADAEGVDYDARRQITDVSTLVNDEQPMGSYEVQGWYFDPRDIVLE